MAKTTYDLYDWLQRDQRPLNLSSELLRPLGSDVPHWLKLCAALREDIEGKHSDAIKVASRLLDTNARIVYSGTFSENSDRELLTEKVRRVVALAVKGHDDIPWDQYKPTCLEHDLLEASLRSAAALSSIGGFGPASSGTTAGSCDMLVLVTAGNKPAAFELRLWRVPIRGRVQAVNTLVRAPGSALWVTDEKFDTGCRAVSALLKHHAASNTQFAIAWDLRPLPLGEYGNAETFTAITGNSASAAMGLGALWLLRQFVDDAALRADLFQLEPRQVAVTAALSENARSRLVELGSVGGVDVKAEVFWKIDSANRALPTCFVLHDDQKFSGNRLDGTPWDPLRVSDFRSLIREAANKSQEKLSASATQLFEYLVEGKTLEGIREAAPNLFADVAEGTPESIKGYLLQRFAKWARGDYDVLEHDPRGLSTDFVDIRLVDRGSQADKRERRDPSTHADTAIQALPDQPIKHLGELIGSDPRAKAWLLVAGPGAGKTSLLAHWELGRVAHALHRRYGIPEAICAGYPDTPEFEPSWPSRAPDDHAVDEACIELCIFVPLKELLGQGDQQEQTARDALAQFWKGEYPDLPSIEDLLASPNVRIRFLLDAVNEFGHRSAEGQRQLNAIAAWLRTHKNKLLRPVLTVRELQRDISLQSRDWQPREAQLQLWDAQDTRKYIERRLSGDQHRAGREALLTRIARDPNLAELFRTPGNLAVQCTLLRNNPRQVLTDRAALFSALANIRIDAAKDRIGDEMLTADDRQHLNALRTDGATLTRLPDDGRLVPGLTRFAALTRFAGSLTIKKRELRDNPSLIDLTSSTQVDQWVAAGREATFLSAPRRTQPAVDDGNTHVQSFETDRVSWTWELFSEFFWARGRKPDAALAEELRRTAVPLDPPIQRELVERLKFGALQSMPRAVDHPQTQSLIFAVQLRSDEEDIESWITWLAAIDLTLAGRIAVAVRSRLEPKADQCWDKSAAMNARYGAANPALKTLRANLLRGFTEPLLDPGKPDEANSYADIRHRREWALLLGELGGDARFELCESATVKDQAGQGVRYLKPKAEYLCRIGDPQDDEKATTYWIGDETSGKRDEVDTNGNLVAIKLKPYHVSAFPVTNAEYRYFVEAGGYEDERWWRHKAAKRWREDFVKKRSGEGRALQPRGSEYPDRGNGLQPVTGICWFEATAYASWLSACEGATTPSKMIRLLTEGEWRAAAGGEGKNYGKTPKRHRRRWAHGVVNGQVSPEEDPLLINFAGTRLGTTSPVGLFPRSRTPERVEDLSGNSWEWTSSAYTERLDPDALQAGYGQDEAETLPKTVALAGGACWSGTARSRVSYRDHSGPDLDFSLGFRLCGWRAPIKRLLDTEPRTAVAREP